MSRKKVIIHVTEKYNYECDDYSEKFSVEYGLNGGTKLLEHEYPHLYLDHEITDEELYNAINVITTSLMQNDSHMLIVDLDVRERLSTPIKEMTVEDVEKALGYRVKIIGGEKE